MDDLIETRDFRFSMPDDLVANSYTGGDSTTKLSWPMLRRGEMTANGASPMALGHAAQAAVDMVRTKIASSMQDNTWTTLAVTAPTAQCGTTTMAVALADSLARHRDSRVILFDFNLRRPGIAKMLGLKGHYTIKNMLDGTAGARDCIVRRRDNLAIVPNSFSVVDPAEILFSANAKAVVQRVQTQLAPNFMIFDLPPMLEHDDLLGFLPFVDQVLLVLGAERSSFGQTDACERELSGRGKLLGVVLNQCQLGLGQYDV